MSNTALGFKPMCTTKTKKWGYRITNPTTKARVTVGPFVDEFAAEEKMRQAHGNAKKLVATKTFDFTPSWNGWGDVEYKGEDIETYYTMPQDL